MSCYTVVRGVRGLSSRVDSPFLSSSKVSRSPRGRVTGCPYRLDRTSFVQTHGYERIVRSKHNSHQAAALPSRCSVMFNVASSKKANTIFLKALSVYARPIVTSCQALSREKIARLVLAELAKKVLHRLVWLAYRSERLSAWHGLLPSHCVWRTSRRPAEMSWRVETQVRMQSDATMFAGLVGASRVLYVSSIMTLTSHTSFAISTPYIAKVHRSFLSISTQYRLDTAHASIHSLMWLVTTHAYNDPHPSSLVIPTPPEGRSPATAWYRCPTTIAWIWSGMRIECAVNPFRWRMMLP